MQLKTIKQEEYQKYQDILNNHGFNVTDFTLTEEPAKVKILPDDTEPKGAITITYRNNNRSKTYPSATGNPWTKLFEQDLAAGFFK